MQPKRIPALWARVVDESKQSSIDTLFPRRQAHTCAPVEVRLALRLCRSYSCGVCCNSLDSSSVAGKDIPLDALQFDTRLTWRSSVAAVHSEVQAELATLRSAACLPHPLPLPASRLATPSIIATENATQRLILPTVGCPADGSRSSKP